MSIKYELTDETKNINGITLHRIRALRDIPSVGVKYGDLGGWIKEEHNLCQNGDAWVYVDARVYDNARVYGDARVYGGAEVCGNARVYGGAEVCGNARVYGYARVFGDAWVYGGAEVCGNARVYDNARVYGGAEVCNNARVFGYAWVFGDARVCDNARVYGNAWVFGGAEVCGNALVYGNADYMTFKNSWSSGRWFTYTRSNKMWKVGCFYGSGDELIKKAYADSELSGKCYEAIVRAVETIEAAKAEAKGDAR